MRIRKPLSEEQLAACKRLRDIWQSRAKLLKLTQEQAAAAMECNQSAINHWLTGRTAIGFEAMFRWADLLRVHPYEIDPTFADRLPLTLRLMLDACAPSTFVSAQLQSPYSFGTPSASIALHDGGSSTSSRKAVASRRSSR